MAEFFIINYEGLKEVAQFSPAGKTLSAQEPSGVKGMAEGDALGQKGMTETELGTTGRKKDAVSKTTGTDVAVRLGKREESGGVDMEKQPQQPEGREASVL